MKCPRCNSATKVTDGRQRMTGWKRTRKCIECGFKVRTTEVYAEHPSQTPLMTRSAEPVREGHTDSDIRDGGADNVLNSTLGDDIREESGGRGLGLYYQGRIQADGAITILENVKREMSKMLSGSEIDAIDYAIECTRVRAELLEMIEEVRNS